VYAAAAERCDNRGVRLPLPLAILATMLLVALAIELAVAGRPVVVPKLPLAVLLVAARIRTRKTAAR